MKLISITAVWCPACLIMRPKIEKIKKEFDIEYIDYDFDIDEEMINDLNVGNILPVFIMMDGNKEIKRLVGEKKEEEILEFMKGCL